MYDALVCADTPCSRTEFFEVFHRAEVGSVVCRQSISDRFTWAYLIKVNDTNAVWHFDDCPRPQGRSFSMRDDMSNRAFMAGRTLLTKQYPSIDPDLLWE